ncbi:copper resistance D family protein [Actinocrispum wychmicini]|uniref:Putative copper resistance protein D n=1 Tax=Actinocrispum wychmicini TaxID=1213861 RepID=A0A4R2JGH4_9PSEU|nr:CopD family protein [Actinocrispum wychmicini]TCO55988.1 putative copper resistance protein D [Actinocrispum wychmicini]
MNTIETGAPRYALFGWTGVGALAGVLAGLALTADGSLPGVVTPPPAVVVGLPVAKAVLDLAAVTTVGLSILPLLVGLRPREGSARVLARARRWAVIAAAVWLAGTLASLALETADVFPGRPVTFGEIGWYVTNIGSGNALLIVAGCVLGYLVIGLFAVRYGESVPAELRIGVAVFALLPLAATGHAAPTGPGLRGINTISMHLHVITAVLWTGGLLAVIMLMVADRALLADVLPRYSLLATACVFLTAGTGAFNGWFVLYETPGVHWYAALFDTGYGRIVLLKVAAILAAGLLGARTRFALLPRLRRQQPAAIGTLAALELGVMGVAYGLAAVLVRAPVIGG